MGTRYGLGMRRTLVAFLRGAVALLALALVACAKNKPAETSVPEPVSHFFVIKVADHDVRMQLAVYEGEQERGLMDRRDLGPDDGMLFVYQKPQQMRFWMRNTPTPLDIGYFDENGVLLEVYPMQPFDESTVSSRSQSIKFPLEMNQGWYRANGIKPGAKLDLKALAVAMKARGFDPRKFGLEVTSR